MTMRTVYRAILIIFALWLAPSAAADEPRRLAVPSEALIAVELATVGMVPMSGAPVVLLREPDSGSVVPIFIGPTEARAIIAAQRAIEMPRPMTHDLGVSLIAGLGGRLERVIVDELRDGTYFGALKITRDQGEPLLIDSRPSDALALAVRTGAAIFVSPDVLAAGADIPFEGLGGSDEVVTALGISVMQADNGLREALDLPDEPGVLVSGAVGLASLAGVRPGAFITRVNDLSVSAPLAFLEQVNATARGEKAAIELWLAGERRTIELDVDVPALAPRRERRDSL
ncbi:MAG: bifunctional nuclease domain-containing protein [Wenzhouxiangella sp.]|jgi:bifunctional DNase/RNase|nr:bifunctional nuclease domain-containing protein [Wenzhouxiangella sp.]